MGRSNPRTTGPTYRLRGRPHHDAHLTSPPGSPFALPETSSSERPQYFFDDAQHYVSSPIALSSPGSLSVVSSPGRAEEEPPSAGNCETLADVVDLLQEVFLTGNDKLLLDISEPFRIQNMVDRLQEVLLDDVIISRLCMIGGGEQSLHQRRYLCHKHILDLTKLLCYKIERLPSRLALQGVQLLEREPRNGGSFSDVYFGQYADTTVALKRLRVVQHNYHRFTAKKVIKRFIREVLIWANLRPHSNVVPLLGTDAANFTHAPCIVLPWMRNGNLSSYLTNPANAAECNSPRVLLWMQQIASGLAYLHQHHIAHGDMRAANILLDHNLIAQITDFGLSRLASDYVTQVSSDGRAPYWLAPELHAPDVFGLEHARPRAEADVYAYACVCFELFTGSPPYSRLTAVQIWNRMQRGERPLRPVFHFTGHRMSDELWRVVEQCLSFRLHERPLSHALAEDLLLIEYACDDGM